MRRLLSAILIVGCLSACACSKKEESEASLSKDPETQVTVEDTVKDSEGASSSETEMAPNEDGLIPLFNGTEEDALNVRNADLHGGPDFFAMFSHGEKEDFVDENGNKYEAYQYTALDKIVLNPEPTSSGTESKEVQLYYAIREDGAEATIVVFDAEHIYPITLSQPLYYNPEKKCLVMNWLGWNQDFYYYPEFGVSPDRQAGVKHDNELMFGTEATET